MDPHGFNEISRLRASDADRDSAESLRPDAPVLRITGTCVMGGIDVKRKARKQRKGQGQDPALER